ncbi:MAG TPA: hypothetical protein PKE21_11410 [Flavobacteriales bacterium]|nr:hypothetical protein [Flavobacteriales bacterium]HMR28078.1 hypothetical protein [Flavobacteriales bacterium]
MLRRWPLLLISSLLACRTPHYEQGMLRNATIRDHVFLEALHTDARYTGDVANKLEGLLLHLCFAIEAEEVRTAEQFLPSLAPMFAGADLRSVPSPSFPS